MSFALPISVDMMRVNQNANIHTHRWHPSSVCVCIADDTPPMENAKEQKRMKRHHHTFALRNTTRLRCFTMYAMSVNMDTDTITASTTSATNVGSSMTISKTQRGTTLLRFSVRYS